MSSSERDPKAEAVILARKAREDAAAMRELAGNSEISDEIVGFHAQQRPTRIELATFGLKG